MEGVIKNRVAESALKTLNLEPYLPNENSLVEFDLEPFLFRGLILREKDFRQSMDEHDWEAYQGKSIAIFCSADAIIPMWAYMLVASQLNGIASHYVFGTINELLNHVLRLNINANIKPNDYVDGMVIVKGCGNKPIPPSAYVEITKLLRPVVKSLMFGEACSTVPVYKQKRK